MSLSAERFNERIAELVEEIERLKAEVKRLEWVRNNLTAFLDEKDVCALEQAHNEYEVFVSDKEHLGFNAEGYWMASRGLLDTWLARKRADAYAKEAK